MRDRDWGRGLSFDVSSIGDVEAEVNRGEGVGDDFW